MKHFKTRFYVWNDEYEPHRTSCNIFKMFHENFCFGVLEPSKISDQNLNTFSTVPAQFSTFISRFNIFMRKCRMDTRKSAFGLPHFILFDIIYFVFIAYEEKIFLNFCQRGGLIFTHRGSAQKMSFGMIFSI